MCEYQPVMSPMPSSGPTWKNVNHGSNTKFMESLNTTTISDSANTVDELKQGRKRKIKKVA